MSASARTRLRFLGITAVVASLLAFGSTGAVATFSAQEEVPATVGTATLLPVPSAEATVDAEGIERVTWDAPASDGGGTMTYKLTRSIDSAPATVVTDGLFARSSTKDLSVDATLGTRTFTDLSAGLKSSCAVSDGDLYCWGSDPAVYSQTPTEIARPAGAEDLDFTAVSVGGYHDCAIMENGAVYCWGQQGSGVLGTEPRRISATSVPVPVAHPTTTGQKFIQISAAKEYTCAILADPGETVGDIYCWGRGFEGQLGHGQIGQLFPISYGVEADRHVPTKVAAPSVDMKFSTVSTSNEHACAVSVAGGAYCWGKNFQGSVGQMERDYFGRPLLVRGSDAPGLVTKDIATGGQTSCAVTQTSTHPGEVYCWGRLVDSDFPTLVTVPGLTSDNPAVSVYGGQSETICATLLDGQTACWGNNYYGQAGNSLNRSQFSPATVLALPLGAEGEKFASVDIGDDHSCGLLTDGRAACWGDNGTSSLGVPGASLLLTPTLVDTNGPLICEPGWLKLSHAPDKCVPGPGVDIRYEISYLLQGWSPSTATEITASYQ